MLCVYVCALAVGIWMRTLRWASAGYCPSPPTRWTSGTGPSLWSHWMTRVGDKTAATFTNDCTWETPQTAQRTDSGPGVYCTCGPQTMVCNAGLEDAYPSSVSHQHTARGQSHGQFPNRHQATAILEGGESGADLIGRCSIYCAWRQYFKFFRFFIFISIFNVICNMLKKQSINADFKSLVYRGRRDTRKDVLSKSLTWGYSHIARCE